MFIAFVVFMLGTGNEFGVFDPVGTDTGDMDVLQEQFMVQGFGIGFDKDFGCGIDAEVGQGLKAGNRGDIEDA